MNTYVAIRSEGGLIPPDTLDKLAQEALPGQKASDFGLDRGRRLSDEIARAWSDALDYWHIFQRRAEALPEDDLGTTLTRDRWILPLLNDLLGYTLEVQRPAPQIEGKSYPISHRADPSEEAPPVHIAGFRQNLDRRPESGRPRLSPQALVQEYLNRSEPHLWGIVTNGLQLRLLRDSARTSRPTYLEFDLQAILEGQRFGEFSLLFRLCHRSRLPRGADDATSCLLEQYYQASLEEGARVRDHLRDGVEQALLRIGTGLLQHPANRALREAVQSGQLTPYSYYQQLLRLIYRLLFLMVAEERRLILTQGPETERAQRIYDAHYSLRRLRQRAEQPWERNHHSDLWIGLHRTFTLFSANENALGIPPLNGDLFGPEAIPNLEHTSLDNHVLLEAVRHLSLFRARGLPQRVNYAGLDVEELGSVYESLLDFQPMIRQGDNGLEFALASGTERKSTGSYYTHPGLVAELIKSALVPVLENRLKNARTAEEQEKALLSMTVCDPATGSGHFLLAAARRLGRELARIRTGEDEPTPEEFRRAVRDVVRHCLYGVDINPLAVDLCKLALWIEGHNVGLPLTFLDHRIKCGNSLIGIFRERPAEVPDEAFAPVTGDDKKVATAVRKRNREERKPSVIAQLGLLEEEPVDAAEVDAYARVALLPENRPGDVHAKRAEYQAWYHSEPHLRRKLEADIWCAAFFWPLDEVSEWLPTNRSYLMALSKPSSVPRAARERIEELAQRHRFFHWCLEFPDVFARGGFDVVLGNPPWERIKLQEQEFFASRDPEIARAPNKAARARLIRELPATNPALAIEFAAALRAAEGESKFARQSGRFPLAGRGDINTYAVFSELAFNALAPAGRAGIVVPIGIATDDTLKAFFSHLVGRGALASLHGFENEAFIFPATHHAFKFCLLTLSQDQQKTVDFVFFCRYPEHLSDPQRHFSLTAAEIALLNPNTRTCPVFRTCADAELTKAIYRRVPVLAREAQNDQPEENPWGVKFLAMFHMANDSHLFKTAADFPGGMPDGYLPLYEAKMMHQFDHRWGTYEGATQAQLNAGILPPPSEEQKRDPHFMALPRYWIAEREVLGRLVRLSDDEREELAALDEEEALHFLRERAPRWLIGFRDVTSNVVERTAIFAVVPRVGAGHTLPLVFTDAGAPPRVCLLANLNTMVSDYVLRNKMGGGHLSYFLLEQLPLFRPDHYSQADLDFIVPRVLELTCTAWDLKPFAEDILRESGRWPVVSDQQRPGTDHRPLTPDHQSPATDDFPPPFTWDPDRRALLRAELDAYYAHLYGLNRKQLRYLLDPHGLSAKELEDILDPWEDPTCSGPHLLPAEPALDFPSETFRVLKEKEERLYGEYRTRRLVLEAWGRRFGG